jgi:putative tricarboxylic transport membrane protein
MNHHRFSLNSRARGVISSPSGTAAWVIVAAISLMSAGTVRSQSASSSSDYPGGPITYIIPFAPGGAADPAGREFVRLLARELGTRAVVQNLPGGEQSIGVSAVLAAKPDGRTLGLSSSGGVVVQPLINPSLPYKSRADYTPVVKMTIGPYGLFVSRKSPHKTWADMLAFAKSNPGKLRVGTGSRLTSNAFALFALEQSAGISTTMVPFSGGGGETVLALLSGELDAAVLSVSGQTGLVKSGEMKALAHTGPKGYRALPAGTSFEELGLNVPFGSEFLTIAPAGLPPAVREKLIAAATKVANGDAWQAWCASKGLESDALSGDALDAWLDDQIEINKRMIAIARARTN